MQNSQPTSIQRLSSQGQAKAVALLQRWPNVKDFIYAYRPQLMPKICANISRCFDLDNTSPTLQIVDATYGEGVATSFLALMIRDALTAVEGKDAMNVAQIDSLCRTWQTDPFVRQLKLSEIFVFFHYFKSGLLGVLYGSSITPKHFSDALQAFRPIRAREIEAVENAKAAARREQAREGAITFAEWKRMNKDKVSPQVESIVDCITSN